MTARIDRWRPHVLAAALLAGLAAANVARVPFALGAALALLTALALVDPKMRLAAVGLALAVVAWTWASARLDVLDRSVLAREIGTAGEATVVVTAPPRRSRYEVRVAARVMRFRDRPLSENVQLKLPPGRAPPQGAVLSVFGRIVEPEHDDDFDERAWLRLRGVHVVLRAGADWRVIGRRGGLGALADRLRAGLLRGLATTHGERRAVLAGIVLGEDEGLSQELKDAFRTSGLYHLLAVSGSNVALLTAGVLLLVWLLGASLFAGHVAVVVAIAGYVLAVGWQPSVVRAGVAGALASVAWLSARERERWWLLLAGAVVLLAWNPYSIRDAGFQLSFAAVVAIFVAAPRVLAFLEGYPVPRGLALVVSIAFACSLATAPISWLHFHSIPLYAVLANAVAAPVAGMLLGLALVAAVVAPIAPSAAATLAWVDGWLAAYLIACARLVAALPFAQLSSARAVGVVCGIALGVLLAARLRAPRRVRSLALGGLCALALVGWTLSRGPDPPPPPNGLRVSFLDVGQGDGCLIQAPGAAILVDQGPPEARVADQLRRLGVRRVTALVLTHPQRDHVGGAADVLRKLEVGLVLDPRLATTGPEETAAIAEARARRVPVVAARAGRVYRVGPLRVAVLWPDGPGFPGEDPNLRAIVLVVTYGHVDVLLTADAESEVTLPLEPPEVEVLKVAHHGSSDDGLSELLDRTRPRVAVVSVGLDNDYGHPTPSTLHTLHAAGVRLYRTDLDGRVVVESDGRRLWVRSER